MDNYSERIKRLRKEILKTFVLLFVPNVIVCVITSTLVINPMSNFKYQIGLFLTYFRIALSLYIFAPKLVDRD